MQKCKYDHCVKWRTWTWILSTLYPKEFMLVTAKEHSLCDVENWTLSSRCCLGYSSNYRCVCVCVYVCVCVCVCVQWTANWLCCSCANYAQACASLSVVVEAMSIVLTSSTCYLWCAIVSITTQGVTAVFCLCQQFGVLKAGQLQIASIGQFEWARLYIPVDDSERCQIL